MVKKFSLALMTALMVAGASQAQISYAKEPEQESNRGGYTAPNCDDRDDHESHHPTNSIPEPGTLALAGVGALALLRRRRK